ncbi:hypothetical protein, conserved [Trypanosoma brucei gambiense DAL972]|uniref:CRAL-TRIO domain-containing protein n=1 Tax=Trypanosoma brucei gambiense (strain MHOM/CI/86/DAL972) TaxID=679716 RepID=C9ZMF6_TRYB9|nr:hypothetical protein, conserved [Trypanosoma brucei gambiense DAL972]CBH10830.1 hypothetical protein, conserved [Trypanosoma brucei gambiense DAL972]|eukprot:XP_011773117.1 hypothetical protein, conserved [Trypanosoma brucei gambiense DAL972]
MSTHEVDVLLSHLGYEATTHRKQLQDLKNRIGIAHTHFDCWLYAFLESKDFNVPETIRIVEERETMERTELCNYTNVDTDIHSELARGVVQIIGSDRLGRVCLYVCTARYATGVKNHSEYVKMLDVVMTYATRLREENKSCRVILLIDQQNAEVLKSMELCFQKTVATRISRFYPGLIERVFIVNMSKIAAVVARPLLNRALKDISGSIVVVSEAELRRGFLLQWFDQAVLPTELGGELNTVEPARWRAFADAVTCHFCELQKAIKQDNLTVKEWELQQLQLRAAGRQLQCKDGEAEPFGDITKARHEYGDRHERGNRSYAEEQNHLMRNYCSVRDEIIKVELIKRNLVLRSMSGCCKDGEQTCHYFREKYWKVKRHLAEEKHYLFYVKIAVGVAAAILLTAVFFVCRVTVIWWDWVLREDITTLIIAVVAGAFSAVHLPWGMNV